MMSVSDFPIASHVTLSRAQQVALREAPPPVDGHCQCQSQPHSTALLILARELDTSPTARPPRRPPTCP